MHDGDYLMLATEPLPRICYYREPLNMPEDILTVYPAGRATNPRDTIREHLKSVFEKEITDLVNADAFQFWQSTVNAAVECENKREY